jgi:tRNA(Ile)-lysidine synthase
MSAVREVAGCRIVRPLLGTSRTRLAALLEAERQPFISDPSNRNPIFERARLREEGGIAAGQALDDILSETRQHGRERIRRERELAALLAGAVSLHPAGFAVLEPEPIQKAAPELAENLLERVAATIGGAHYPVRRERAARLRTGLIVEPPRARTLGGCRFVPWRARILVLRELAAAEDPLLVEPGQTIVWDRRYEVTSPLAAERAATVGYLGSSPAFSPSRQRADKIDSVDEGLRGKLRSLPGLARSTLPAMWDAEGLLAVPHIGYRRAGSGALPRIAFRPANPLSQGWFTVV